MPGQQGSDKHGQNSDRWRDALLLDQGTRLPRLSYQTAVLSEGAGAQNPAQHLRASP